MKNIIKEISPFNNIESENKLFYSIKIVLKSGFVYCISLIFASILVIIAQCLLGFDPSGEGMDFNVSLLFKYYGYIATIITFFIFLRKFEKIKLSDIGINKDYISLLKGIGIGFITLIVIIGILLFSNQVKFTGLNNNINYGMFILFVFAWLIQSSMEEIICRGYLFNKLKNKMNLFLAIFISFISFSILHFLNYLMMA